MGLRSSCGIATLCGDRRGPISENRGLFAISPIPARPPARFGGVDVITENCSVSAIRRAKLGGDGRGRCQRTADFLRQRGGCQRTADLLRFCGCSPRTNRLWGSCLLSRSRSGPVRILFLVLLASWSLEVVSCLSECWCNRASIPAGPGRRSQRFTHKR